MTEGINSAQRKAIAVALPWDGKPGFIEAIDGGKLKVRGIDEYNMLRYIDELHASGSSRSR